MRHGQARRGGARRGPAGSVWPGGAGFGEVRYGMELLGRRGAVMFGEDWLGRARQGRLK